MLTACAQRPPASDFPRIQSHALSDTADTRLGQAYLPMARLHPGESGFRLLPNGPESLMMRIALAEAAQKSLDLQYFSTRDDTTGKLLLEAVRRAAARGVRVRMLLDDWNLDDFEAGAAALNNVPNIEIRAFNPYSIREESIFDRVGSLFSYIGHFNHHMHNKALIADNQVAIMGGRNLGDEYFDASRNINFRDIDIFAVGPVTRQISRNFDRYWNSDESFPVSMLDLPGADAQAIAKVKTEMHDHWQAMLHSRTGRRLEQIPLPHKVKEGEVPLIWATAELAADSPKKIEKPDDDIHSVPAERIQDLVAGARHEFIVFTPYFVPLDDGVDWLTGLVARGVHVRIVTNSLASTDMVPAQAGYEHYRESLVKGGVELYEIKPDVPKRSVRTMFKPSSQSGLHAKVYMIDRRVLVIGSFNLDPRSIHLNTEQVLVIHSPKLCEGIVRLFDELHSPQQSYHVISADDVPQDMESRIHGPLAWETEESGKTVYYDFSPHAGFWRRATEWAFSLLPIDDQL